MSFVAEGLNSLFSSGAQPQEPQNIGPVASGEQYAQMLQQAQQAKQPPQPGAIQDFFQQYKKQSDALNALRPQQTPLQMAPTQTQVPMPQIQQQDLMGLLQLLGGGK